MYLSVTRTEITILQSVRIATKKDFYQKDYLKVYSDLFYTIFRDVLLIDLRNDKNTVRLLSDLRSLLKTKK